MKEIGSAERFAHLRKALAPLDGAGVEADRVDA
jgi:hypothetical protein